MTDIVDELKWRGLFAQSTDEDALRKALADGPVTFYCGFDPTAPPLRATQRRYVISMTVRTISVILAATLWNVERHVAIVALVLGAVLPYIAVVIANAGRENAPSLPSTFVTAPMKPMIAPPRTG
ncbi:hypothetical protein STENM223S_03825 [Streptomyces tendae]